MDIPVKGTKFQKDFKRILRVSTECNSSAVLPLLHSVKCQNFFFAQYSNQNLSSQNLVTPVLGLSLQLIWVGMRQQTQAGWHGRLEKRVYTFTTLLHHLHPPSHPPYAPPPLIPTCSTKPTQSVHHTPQHTHHTQIDMLPLVQIARLSITQIKSWVALSSLVVVVRPASVTSQLISTIWSFRLYKPYIF